MNTSNTRQTGVALAIDFNKETRNKYFLFLMWLIIAAAIATVIRVLAL